MAKTLSIDLRLRVCTAISEGLSCHEAAARFDVSIATAIRWQAQKRMSTPV
jgi:transposase